jgi:hypothetical protein
MVKGKRFIIYGSLFNKDSQILKQKITGFKEADSQLLKADC